MFRVSIITLVCVLFVFCGFYFITNPSYEDSLQAKVNYFLKDYESAYGYAKKAYDKDRYNKMAFTVLTQSKIALEHKGYIKRGLEYLGKIKLISKKKSISSEDRSRIKLMCEIMLGEYKNLPLSKLTDEELKNSAKKTNDRFKKIYDGLF